jgi:hypothetical protein
VRHKRGLTCITAARSSKSKCDSMRCLVTVFAMPFDWRPSNWRASKLPSQRSSSGTMPRKKNSHTRHIGAQKPTPGPLPTGPASRLTQLLNDSRPTDKKHHWSEMRPECRLQNNHKEQWRWIATSTLGKASLYRAKILSAIYPSRHVPNWAIRHNNYACCM